MEAGRELPEGSSLCLGLEVEAPEWEGFWLGEKQEQCFKMLNSDLTPIVQESQFCSPRGERESASRASLYGER